MFKFFRPKATLTEDEVKSGLRWVTIEGAVSMGFFSITTSGILVAFALTLGAENYHIGILAAIPFIMQIIQIPAIWLIESFRRRKIISVLSWFVAQLCWFPVALIPFFLPIPGKAAIALLIGIMAFRGIMSAICNASWNSWQRDLIPQNILGRFFSRRMAYATAFAAVFSVCSAIFIDYWRNSSSPEDSAFGYSYAILFGAIFLGLGSVFFMALIPEPLMQPVTGQQPSIRERLAAPLRDSNFRRLLRFLFYWSFASNLAIPFFAVHILQTLGMPVIWVIGLSILSQVFNILFLRVWGPLADRFSNKVVLSIGISLYLLVIVGWIFVTLPGKYFFTVPLLIILYIFAGIASAAVSFTIGTIGLKLSPKGEATSYLATASLATNIGAGLGPVAGGFLADFFATRQLNLTFTWIDPASTINLPFISIIGRDFLFGIAFLLGILTIGMLATIREEGDVGREVILESLYQPIKDISRPMSTVPGFTFLANFPFGFFKRVPPGLDVALGVTIYQIAEMARGTALAATRGRSITRKMASDLGKNITRYANSRKKIREHGMEIVQHTVRGAMHVVDEKPVNMDKLIEQVVEGVITASSEAGMDSRDSLMGASQGVVQGAVETGMDVTEAVKVTLKAVKKASGEIGMSGEEAASVVGEGVILAAESLGSEVVAEVVEAVPNENLPLAPEEQDEKSK
ncbi:MAG: MFS transporter [Dehalococcoidales bacterium]|nr:MAG: MFS transporter [Dehalococcoidales bacterium]